MLAELFGATGHVSPGDEEDCDESAAAQEDEISFYRGRHYAEYVDEVKELKRGGRLEEAAELLLDLIEVVEREAEVMKWGVAPWYYEQAAIVFRKLKAPEREVQVLERYADRKRAPGRKSDELLSRLCRLRSITDRAAVGR